MRKPLALSPSRGEARCPGHANELCETSGFGLRHRGAERRDSVVAPPLIVVFGRRAIACFDEKALLEHALDRAIQRAGAELQFSAGTRFDVLDNRVAVAVLVGQREQDVKRRGRQREQTVDLFLDFVHDRTIATVDTLSMAIDGSRGRLVYCRSAKASRSMRGAPPRG